MKNTYEYNVRNLLYNKSYLIDCLNEKESDEYNINDSGNGINVEKEGYTYRLTSYYNQEYIVDRIIKKFENATPYEIFILIGLADGNCLERIFNKYPKNTIIVYEPSSQILKLWLDSGDKKDILISGNIFISSGKIGKKYYNIFLDQIIKYNNTKHISFYILPGYQSIWTEETIWCYKACCDHISMELVVKNTVMAFGHARTRKYFRNLYDLKMQYSLKDLCEKLKESCPNNKNAAIIVSAGPSLEKNVSQLELFKGKALIIAVDSAIKTLEINNIEPDIVVTIDSEKRLDFIEGTLFRNIPLIIETTGNSDIHRIHNGRRFYAATGEIYTNKLIKKFNKSVGYMKTGGSVANSAFSFVLECGFKNIILVGQDLAYPNNKLHAEATYVDKKENELIKDEKYYEIEDIYGNKVLTEKNMDMYREWFERVISENDQLNVIDATEGGAKINGTKIEKLKDVLSEDFISNEAIDYKDIINRVNPIFTEDDRLKYEEMCTSLPEILQKDKKRLKDGILSYENINRLRKRGLQNSKEFKKEYSKVSKINYWLKTYENIELLNMYEPEKEYEIQERILDVKENENDEWNEIIDLGLKYCNKYIDAIDDILEDIHFLIDGR